MVASGERVDFPGASGARLAARLDLPAGPIRAHALFAHCFTCSKDVHAASRISRGLAERGIAVLRFDFTGLGSSQGDFANTHFSSNVEDLLAAAEFLRREREAPRLLVGHSLGGAAVLAAAGRVPETTAVATIAAPCSPDHVTRLLAGAVPEIEAAGEAEVRIGGRSFRIRKSFLDDLATQRLSRKIEALGRALLVFHSPRDEVVDVENARHIYETARHPKSFVSLDDADHLLTRRSDAAYTAGVLAAWAERYLPEGGAPARERELPAGTVEVAERGSGRLSQLIRAGSHQLAADEPERDGGGDTGPTPYELLLAGLGACTSMTLRLYAERKGLPLERVAVRLSHARIHARDCEQCESGEGKIDRIDTALTLQGPLDAAQRQRLLEIAERCPVHRSLQSENWIVTTLDEG